jgi:diguanylate cyclase (GGDEF)-like protein
MYNRKWLLLTVLTLTIVLPFLAGCSNEFLGHHPQAVGGILDLTQWQPEKEVIRLDGEWEFYWNRLLEPPELNNIGTKKDGYINLPSSWNKYTINDKKLPGDGYATFRLLFKTDKSSRLAIKIPRIFTSYDLWVNKERIASSGTTGKSREAMTPQYLPQVAFFEAKQGENEIVIQVSNFYHRSGGILESLILGNEKWILDLRYRNLASELLLFGSLMIIGAYHLALFLFRGKDYSPLCFGLFCILVSIRTLLVGERFFIYLLPGFNWEIAHKIQTAVFYLGTPLITMFFKSIFPQDVSSKFVRTSQLIGFVFVGLVLLTPAKVFTVFNPVYQLFALCVILYLVGIFAKQLRKKTQGIGLIITGALALFITTLNDMVFLSIWMNDHSSSLLRTLFRSGSLSSVGQLIFVFTYSLVLAQKFSHALDAEEVMTAQLKEMNVNLDQLVKKRTEDLEKSKQKIEDQKAELEKINQVLHLLSLKDPLTNLWNRRHFDRAIHLEWRRSLRHKRPISLLIVDIDHFKKYNDGYGHTAGDACLVQIAQAITDSFRRASDLVVRYGGEEFVVLLPDLEKNDAINMALLLQKNIEDLNIPHHYSPVNRYVTVSIGVTSTIADTNCSPHDLFLAADKALYQAKAAGKNQVNSLPIVTQKQ